MLAIAILAAGKGTRMKSTLPKVLQTIGGESLIKRVIQLCKEIKADRYFLIVGHKAEQIKEELKGVSEIEYVLQQPQQGTGHAAQQLNKVMGDFDGDLLVLNGDVPLLKINTINNLLKAHKDKNADVTLLSARTSNPFGYGRVFADNNQMVSKIVEEKDCTIDEKKNNLINSGVYCFKWNRLKKVLPTLRSNNNQNEIYITDAISRLNAFHVEVNDRREINGINNRVQLAECEQIVQEELRNYWMNNGVTFIDPSSCTISSQCDFGQDVVIEPQTHLRGKCLIGNQCKIGPGSFIEDSTLGDGVSLFYSVVSQSSIKASTQIGPFTNIRPQSEISENCRIGNFVEIKKSIINQSTKINHLSYIGDSIVGEEVNIGAGTITANYDGVNKHQTKIESYVKTGANSVLVAPVTLGSNSTIGAGSTITKDVPKDSLAIERTKQLCKENWSKRTKSNQ